MSLELLLVQDQKFASLWHLQPLELQSACRLSSVCSKHSSGRWLGTRFDPWSWQEQCGVLGMAQQTGASSVKLDIVPNAAKQWAGADSCLQGPGSLSAGAPRPSGGTVLLPVASGDARSSFLTLWEWLTSGAKPFPLPPA